MILGTLDVKDGQLFTKNGNYQLDVVSVISTRRPFLSSGLTMTALLSLFGLGAYDILKVSELVALTVVIGIALAASLTIGQLHLVSRDLRGSPMADAVWGSYRRLNAERRKIAALVRDAKREGMS